MIQINSIVVKEGQKWKYKNRPGENSSTTTILKIEEYPQVTIIHIQVDGLKIPNSKSPEGFLHTLSHSPFSEEAIQNSLTDLISENVTLPEYEEGYAEWKEQFDLKKAGYWTSEIKDAIQAMAQALQE